MNPKLSLERIMREMYGINETIKAEARFVTLSHKTKATDFVVIGVGQFNFIIARVVDSGGISYELSSITPLSKLTVVVYKESKRMEVLSESKLFGPVGIYQLCSCDEQERVWKAFRFEIGYAMYLNMNPIGVPGKIALNHALRGKVDTDENQSATNQAMCTTEDNLNYSCSYSTSGNYLSNVNTYKYPTFDEDYVPKESDWYYNSEPGMLLHYASKDTGYDCSSISSDDSSPQGKSKKKRPSFWKRFKRFFSCIPSKSATSDD